MKCRCLSSAVKKERNARQLVLKWIGCVCKNLLVLKWNVCYYNRIRNESHANLRGKRTTDRLQRPAHEFCFLYDLCNFKRPKIVPVSSRLLIICLIEHFWMIFIALLTIIPIVCLWLWYTCASRVLHSPSHILDRSISAKACQSRQSRY